MIIIADVSFLNQLTFNCDTDLEHSPQHKLDSDFVIILFIYWSQATSY